MSESIGVLHIKQELDTSSSGGATASSCCSPSTSSTSIGASNRNVGSSTYSNSNTAPSSSNSNNNITGSGGGGGNNNNAVSSGAGGGGGSNSNSNGSASNSLKSSTTIIKKTSPSVSPDRQLCSSTTTLSSEMHGSNLGTDCGSIGGSTVAASGAGNGTGTGSIRDELRRLCLVCGDIASGFHYGVASCEACKAFFKRTIQGNIEYTCPANNECEINKRRRKACQACRFQKCLLMGMLKEGVRLDRVRGGRQKYRRNPVSNSYQTMQMLYQASSVSLEDVKILEVLNSYEPDTLTVQLQQHHQQQQRQQPHTTTTDSSDSQKSNAGNGALRIKSETTANTNTTTTAKTPSPTSTATTTAPTSLSNNNKISAICSSSSTSSITSISCILQNNNNDSQEILGILSDLYDKELVGVIGWAKQIPGFMELPLNDQMKLLQVSWAEILTLQLIFRSLPFNGKLCFATDVWMDELLAKECGYTEFYYHCVQIAQRMERLSPRREEYYLLKALLLSNCDILLDDQSSLRAFRDSILNAFNDVVYLLRHSAAVSHQQQLLLLLPSLRQADGILRRFWRNICRDGCVTMKKLFVEMLETIALR